MRVLSCLRRVTRSRQNIHPCPPLKVSTMRAQGTVPNYCYPGLTLFTLFTIDTLNQNPPMHTDGSEFLGHRPHTRLYRFADIKALSSSVNMTHPAKKTTTHIPASNTSPSLSSHPNMPRVLSCLSRPKCIILYYSAQLKCQSLDMKLWQIRGVACHFRQRVAIPFRKILCSTTLAVWGIHPSC